MTITRVWRIQSLNIYEFFTALKIHISMETKILLDINGSFVTEHRGAIEIKVPNINLFNLNTILGISLLLFCKPANKYGPN